MEEEVIKKRHILSAVYALVFIVVITLIIVIFIWLKGEDQVPRRANVGARVHEHNDGLNRDVFVENFLEEIEATSLLVRVRLEEYMEIGTGAGVLVQEIKYQELLAAGLKEENKEEMENEPQVQEQVLTEVEQAMKEDRELYTVPGDKRKSGVIPVSTDPTTWDIYMYKEELRDSYGEEKTIRDYRQLSFGGQTTYMPTFDRNQSHNNVDYNGTVEGYDLIATEGVAYDDYKKYVQSEGLQVRKDGIYYTISQDEEYFYDKYVELPEGTTEYGQYIEVKLEESNQLYKIQNIEHITQETLIGEVVSMEEWLGFSEQRKIGNYWVYDVDGWAYWAEPLKPQTATGLLLDEVVPVGNPVGVPYYYALNVVGQSALPGDWGVEGSEYLGFYKDGITDNAQELLGLISMQVEQDTEK